jgi:predicted RNase H-like HicB family nuclease
VKSYEEKNKIMLKTCTAKYTKIPSGYMGQLVKWPEVITEGKTLDDCRALLQDALQEMVAFRQGRNLAIPAVGS